MINRKYTVKRDEVFVGRLIKPTSLKVEEKLIPEKWIDYRSILFVPSGERLADDLLYDGPNYLILNYSSDKSCLNLCPKVLMVDRAHNLSDLLKFYGYPENLSYEEIIEIRKEFFTGWFAEDHCEVFGYKAISLLDIPKYPEYPEYVIKDRSGCIYVRTNAGVVEECLFDELDSLGDKSLIEAHMSGTRMNAFKPQRAEGPIRKLSR